MLTIQASEGSLVNWPNYDNIGIVPVGPNPDQGHSLIASKNNGENRNEAVLCFGSENDCLYALDLIIKALMAHRNFVSLMPESSGHFADLGGPYDPEPVKTETCPDCGHAVTLHTDGGHSGYTCQSPQCACSTPAWYLHGDDLAV